MLSISSKFKYLPSTTNPISNYIEQSAKTKPSSYHPILIKHVYNFRRATSPYNDLAFNYLYIQIQKKTHTLYTKYVLYQPRSLQYQSIIIWILHILIYTKPINMKKTKSLKTNNLSPDESNASPCTSIPQLSNPTTTSTYGC